MGNTYAFSDIHGQKNIWEQIKRYLRPEDKAYFLGDAIDRGPDGFTIMREIMQDPRITYLKGNHEILMADALETFYETDGYTGGNEYLVWLSNGGESTYQSWLMESYNYEWINVLRKLPTHVTYINPSGTEIVLCHAGFTPGTMPKTERDWIWDRNHTWEDIPEEWRDKKYIVVHGHTPSFLLKENLSEIAFLSALSNDLPENDSLKYEDKYGACFYGAGHKIDIDTGVFMSHKSVLLNLDDLSVIPFEE